MLPVLPWTGGIAGYQVGEQMRHIRDFYRYNSETRKKYLDVIDSLPWAEVIRDRGASFPSIRDVFLHILDAYRYWLEYGLKDNLSGYRRTDRDRFKNPADIREYEQAVDSMVEGVVGNLREQDLTRVYEIHEPNETMQVTMEAILMHMIEEELQHRGEINCMLWQQGIDPPTTDFIEWLKVKTNAELGQPATSRQ